MTCTPETSAQGFCLYHYQFLTMPAWWTTASWALLFIFLTFATLWVFQRSHRS